MIRNVEPVVLEGELVRLAPLRAEHVDDLAGVGLDPRIWTWGHPLADRSDVERYVNTALQWQAAGTAIPFVTVSRTTGKIVGSTRFAAIDRENRRAEIGWTWLSPSCWRTGINTEAKLLMLRHAFQTWGCRRVEFKTDSQNDRSRTAIARLGASFEGILRNHMVTPTERMRHTAYYSILDDEWPDVERRLLSFLARPGRDEKTEELS
ncbi:MAG: GNAT family N-acetyltransferase [bacterium]